MITAKFSRATAIFTACSVLLAAVAIVVNPFSRDFAANATAGGYLAQISDIEVAGLVIKYRDGVNPLAANGDITGSNFAGVELEPGRGIGLNMYSVSFKKPLSKIEIATAMANLARSPKIALVAPDQVLKFAAAANLAPKTAPAAKAPPAASAVQKLKAVDGWSAKKLKLAQIALSWQKPLKTYGAKILGYQIDQSVDSGKSFSILVSKTKPTTLKYNVTKELYAGFSYRFRVRAITKLNVKETYGRFSAVAKAKPTTVPQAPVFAAGDTVINSKAPAWLPQNENQRGGLPVSYLAIASAEGAPDVSCVPPTAVENSCTFVGLDPNKTYRASVRATNSHGSAQSLLTQTATDPMYFHQWYLDGKYGINAPSGWAYSKGSYQKGGSTQRVIVAVLDTGYTPHPDLDNQYVKENDQVYGHDFVSSLSGSPRVSIPTNDTNGWDSNPADPGDFDARGARVSSWHGTHISGLVAAQANNGIGITGVAPEARILPVRVLGPSGGLSSDLAAAITWSIGLPVPQFQVQGAYATAPPLNLHPAQVLNISMGTSVINGCDAATQAAVDAAKAAKVTIVTAAGNGMGNPNAPVQAFNSYPGNCLGTINVGATSSVGDRTIYSNAGPGVDVSAPGGDETQASGTDPDAAGMIISTTNTGSKGPLAAEYGYEEGTSMAAPLVTGIVALMYAVHPGISFEQAATIIINTATPFNDDPELTFKSISPSVNSKLALLGHCHDPNISSNVLNFENDGRCGSGIVNAGAAVAAAAALP
ncbi:MAG: hypothetical protein RLZ28_333 [Actinomycetota bacterium]